MITMATSFGLDNKGITHLPLAIVFLRSHNYKNIDYERSRWILLTCGLT